jgi:hypothetical protein
MFRSFPRSAAGVALSLLLISSARAQRSQALNAAGAAPEILNIVHQQLIPGKEADYANLLGRIANEYSQKRIPVYWFGGQSFTGDSSAIYLNFFSSFAEAQAVNDALNSAMAASPDLVPIQEQLLTFTSRVTNAVAIRRDAISYRSNSVDFSKAHVLRVATIRVRQGHEQEFEEAMKDLSAAYGRLNANSPWVTYQVNAGAPSTTFVIFMPMHSLKEMDDYVARTGRPLRTAEGDAISSRLQAIARDAYVSWDSELYVVSPSTSHVSDEFAAGDPNFWRPPAP